MEKIIKYWETFNSESGYIEKSNSRRNQTFALIAGLLIALGSVLPWLDVTLGDSLPMVITLLGYSLGSSAWNKTIEKKYQKK